MTERITGTQFHETAGVEDWRVLFEGTCAYFRTGSFAASVALVDAIGELADAANLSPDVDLRHEGIFVRLLTHFDVAGISDAYVRLAQQISDAARRLNAVADPAVVQTVQISIDALVHPDVMPFWRAVLGYQELGDEDLVDPLRRAPSIWFQQMDAARPQRNRIHVDVCVAPERAEARVAAAVAAGGRIVFDKHAPMWWTLADAEGNEVDVTSWTGRD